MLPNTNFLIGRNGLAGNCSLDGFGIASDFAQSVIGNMTYIDGGHHAV